MSKEMELKNGFAFKINFGRRPNVAGKQSRKERAAEKFAGFK